MSTDAHTVETARAAAERDDLVRWVAEFLASPGSDNAELGEALSTSHRWWIGPVELPLDRLHRLAGPPGAPTGSLSRAPGRGVRCPDVVPTLPGPGSPRPVRGLPPPVRGLTQPAPGPGC